MSIAKQLREILGPAIDAARAALRDLDDDDVPGRLRTIAKRGDGTLPVPLVKTLFRRIDEDEWFRTKVIETFDRLGSGDEASSAYLHREPGWWMVVAESVATNATVESEVRLRSLESEIDETRARSRAERAKLKALRKDLALAEKASQRAIGDRLDPLKAAVAEARSDRDRAEERQIELRADAEEAREDRREAERIAAEFSEQLRSAKRATAAARRSAEAGASESIPRESIEIARWLDRAAMTLTPFREPRAAPPADISDARSSEAVVPAGIAPDSAASIDALAGLDGVTVLIDGHNVLGVLDVSTMATSRARKELVAALGKLDRHLGDATIEIVFDSHLSDGRPISVAENGVVVRFAAEDVIADDVIALLAEEHGCRAVVISDDREVRDRCATFGATVLWAKALAAWL